MRPSWETERPEIVRMIQHWRKISPETGKPHLSFREIADSLNRWGFRGQNNQLFERRAIYEILKAIRGRESRG